MSVGSDSTWMSWVQNNTNILENVANNLIPVQRLVTGAAYLIGLSFAFKAIYCLKVYAEGRTMMSGNNSIKEPAVYLMVAAILIYFPTGLAMALSTTFGSSNILQYAPINGGSAGMNALFGNEAVGRPLTIIIQTVGGFAFVRGWVLIARSASQGQPPGGTGKGLVHVFGGILALNIVATLQMVNNTIYGTG